MSLYFISDTHFTHDNIRRYCDRPFKSCSEMDEELVQNWNARVSRGDKVIFAGDFVMGSDSVAKEFAERLNGQITVLSGNHDDFDKFDVPFTVVESLYFTYQYKGQEYNFYCSHWPRNYHKTTKRNDSRKEPIYSNPPSWFNGWMIHGHVHNNDLQTFPFVNHTNKTINVGVEVLEYTPIRVDELIDIIRQGELYESVLDVPDEIYRTL